MRALIVLVSLIKKTERYGVNEPSGRGGVHKLFIVVREDYSQRDPTGGLFGNKFEINNCKFNKQWGRGGGEKRRIRQTR